MEASTSDCLQKSSHDQCHKFVYLFSDLELVHFWFILHNLFISRFPGFWTPEYMYDGIVAMQIAKPPTNTVLVNTFIFKFILTTAREVISYRVCWVCQWTWRDLWCWCTKNQLGSVRLAVKPAVVFLPFFLASTQFWLKLVGGTNTNWPFCLRGHCAY